MSPLILSGLLMGLFGGTHCVAMCGGIVSVLCSAAPRCPSAVEGRLLRQAPYWLAYNGGRIVSYAVLGLVFGALGSLASSSSSLEFVRYGLRAFAALSMLAVGLHLLGLPSMISGAESLGAPLWRKLSPLAKRFLPLERPRQALALGALWGLMPCGLLYGAFALAASADSPATGAATMAAFGLGTLPVMLTMGALAQTITRWIARLWVRRAAGIVVLLFGVFSTAGVARQVGLGDPFGLLSPSSSSHRCCPGHH